ncbi:hypothetical protein [Maridesulfovibrio ferrireducens]|uniref:RipA family octameric membrane protein n=1 Tax=Maridesulfovibrio ferrireducens TaxID=246191 RepID=UPI001A2AAF25|nr:hypothetical protein [Maridesulfovibrio ferrireducens]MBI9113038.1 hypothetical protein [Maridesulfovibrio ferrireducens]
MVDGNDLDKYLEQYKSNKYTKKTIEESSTDEQYDFKKISKALDTALDIRKFEIELYWKRATYFWAFIAVLFAGYYQVDDYLLKIILTCSGFLFSVAWFLVNKGSKYWQNNWERHVDALEDMVIGPLYKTILEDKGKGNCFTGAAAYSVTKINQILSGSVVFFWFILLIKTILDLPTLNVCLACFEPIPCLYYLYSSLFHVTVVVLGYAVFLYILLNAKSNHVKESKNSLVEMKSRKIEIKKDDKASDANNGEVFEKKMKKPIKRFLFYCGAALLFLSGKMVYFIFKNILKLFPCENKVEDEINRFSSHIRYELCFFGIILGLLTFLWWASGYQITLKVILRELGALLIFVTMSFEVPFSEFTNMGSGFKGKVVSRIKEAYRFWSVIVVLCLMIAS